MNSKLKGHLNVAEQLVNLLENKFSFMGMRFGLDPLLGLVPGIGDFLAFICSAYIVWIGMRMGLPSSKVSRMVFNIVADLVIGAIPFFGDIADFAFKSNSMNLKIIHEYADKYVEGQLIA